MDPMSDFQHHLVEYLENAHVGEFLTDSKDDVLQQLSADVAKPDYVDPCDVLPTPPPDPCKGKCKNCEVCNKVNEWWLFFKSTVD